MIKHFTPKHIILFSLLFSLSSFVFAQAFDDMAFPNPDNPTYFQQEMTALIKFQAAYNINVPLFASISVRTAGASISKNYYDSLFGAYNIENLSGWVGDYTTYGKSDIVLNGLLGGQIKINNMFYIPVFVQWGNKGADTIIEQHTEKVNMWQGSGTGGDVFITEIKGPANVHRNNFETFVGSGLFINTNIIKGGIYLGVSNPFLGVEQERFEMPYNKSLSSNDLYTITNETELKPTFKIALVPLINTSQWAFVGKVLDSIFGYFGMGDVLYAPDEDKEDSKTAAFAKTINAALDFTFNRINWGTFDLNINALYARGNFSVAAKADTYGLKAAGSFSNFPFGFTLEGGYKHFYAVSNYFQQDYSDTGYFIGSFYFPLKKITLGMIYQYNGVYGSTFSVAMSMNFLKLFIGLNPNSYNADKEKYDALVGMNSGVRFHYNGWKAGRE